jgi:hypothetical protein
MKIPIFQKLLTEEVAEELLSGSKIIDYYLPENKVRSNGYILIEYVNPKKEERGERTFFYAQYNISSGESPKFYLGTQYIKMGIKEVKKRAWNNKI